jgi:type I restriction enzyme S subunit
MIFQRVKLADVVEVNPPPRAMAPAASDLVTFVPMSSVGEDGSIDTSERRPFGSVSKGYTQFCRGDVLLAKITPCMENGKAALVDDSSTLLACGSTEFHVLRAGPDIDPRYLFHLIWNKAFRRLATINMTGSAGQKRVPKSFLQSHEIPLPCANGKPDVREQKRIAAILDKADSIRRKRQSSLSLVDEFLRSLFLEMFGDPLANPKGWERDKLQNVGEVITGATPPSRLAGMFDGDIPFVTPGDLKETFVYSRRTVTTDGARYSRTVRRGATFVCCIGATIGKMGKAAVRSAFNQQINAVEWGDRVNDDYGLEVLRFFKRHIAASGSSTTLPILNKTSFQSLTIPIAPRALQDKFADRVASLEKIKGSQVESSSESERLFHSLQQRAFNGDLSR